MISFFSISPLFYNKEKKTRVFFSLFFFENKIIQYGLCMLMMMMMMMFWFWHQHPSRIYSMFKYDDNILFNNNNNNSSSTAAAKKKFNPFFTCLIWCWKKRIKSNFSSFFSFIHSFTKQLNSYTMYIRLFFYAWKWV